nr:ATP-dependent Clp protease proteolytic subunit 1 [Cyperus amuricus]WOL36651.1 ATP-dependent Clp protease proteolytic subunit 1 [Cyperus amuricus]
MHFLVEIFEYRNTKSIFSPSWNRKAWLDI